MNEPKKGEKNGWTWRIADLSVLSEWFAKFAENPASTALLVKKNPVRSVWKTGDYFIKHNHPIKKLHELRFTFFPKAKSEHNSLMLLAKKGIKSVESLGWASRKADSLLLTKNLDGFINAHTFWFVTAFKDKKLKNAFLESLAKFAGILIHKKIRHPDFHLGNLLYNPENSEFAIVDAYGISVDRRRQLSKKNRLLILRIIASPRGEINDEDAYKFLLNCNVASDKNLANLLWTEILQAESMELEKNWKTIKQKIYLDGKFCARYENDNDVLLIRKNILREELADQDIIRSNHGFRKQSMLIKDAKKIWEDSFMLEIHRIPSVLPIAIIIPEKKNAIQKGTLIYREAEFRSPSVLLSKEELIKRCSICHLPRRLTEIALAK